MSTTPDTTIPLEYATPQPSNRLAAKVWRVARAVLIVFFSGALGAVVGLWLTPHTYHAMWLYKVSGPTSDETVAQIQANIAAHVAEMRSPAVLDAVLADVAATGTAVPAGAEGRALIQRGLTIEPIANSRLVRASFRSPDMTLAPHVMRAYSTQAPSLSTARVEPFGGIPISVSRYRHPAGAIAGALMFAAVVSGLLAWDRRRRRAGGDV